MHSGVTIRSCLFLSIPEPIIKSTVSAEVINGTVSSIDLHQSVEIACVLKPMPPWMIETGWKTLVSTKFKRQYYFHDSLRPNSNNKLPNLPIDGTFWKVLYSVYILGL